MAPLKCLYDIAKVSWYVNCLVELFKRFKNYWNKIWEQFDGEVSTLVVNSEILKNYQNLKKSQNLKIVYA